MICHSPRLKSIFVSPSFLVFFRSHFGGPWTASASFPRSPLTFPIPRCRHPFLFYFFSFISGTSGESRAFYNKPWRRIPLFSPSVCIAISVLRWEASRFVADYSFFCSLTSFFPALLDSIVLSLLQYSRTSDWGPSLLLRWDIQLFIPFSPPDVLFKV